MPDTNELTPLQSAWLAFADSVQVLFVPDLDDTSLYQYVQFRDNVMALIRKPAFLDGLAAAWRVNSGSDTSPIKTELAEIEKLLVMELHAYAQSMRHDPAPNPINKEKKKEWWRKWLCRAKSVAGSVKELPEKLDLPWYVKSGLTAFEELVEAFEHN